MYPALGRALAAGFILGLSYNRLAAVAGATLCAALSVFLSQRDRPWAWLLPLTGVFWVIGDGTAVAARLASLAGGSVGAGPVPVWSAWAALLVWALTGWLLGYLAPAAVGAAVGRRVHFGTGWLAAGAVAFTVAVAVAAIAGPAAAGLAAVLWG